MDNKPPQIGDRASDFVLKDQHNKELRFSDLRNRVLLSFHPLAWTKVCGQQMQSLEAHQKTFHELNTVALGISVDSVPCKHAWAKELGVKVTRLLSDFWPHGEVARLYGIMREKDGISERCNIIVNQGRIVFSKIYDIPVLPDIEEIIAFLKR